MRKVTKLKLNHRSVQINRNKLPAQSLNPPPNVAGALFVPVNTAV